MNPSAGSGSSRRRNPPWAGTGDCCGREAARTLAVGLPPGPGIAPPGWKGISGRPGRSWPSQPPPRMPYGADPQGWISSVLPRPHSQEQRHAVNDLGSIINTQDRGATKHSFRRSTPAIPLTRLPPARPPSLPRRPESALLPAGTGKAGRVPVGPSLDGALAAAA